MMIKYKIKKVIKFHYKKNKYKIYNTKKNY